FRLSPPQEIPSSRHGKDGNTKYMTTNWGELSAKAIITKLKAKKEVKYSRRYHCHYSEIEVVLGKRSVKLFKRSAALREYAQTA
ncbi:hypothetical protein AAAT34_07750, partial [Hallella faecis]|nr:hypothetical protein [Hallella faecis]